MDELKPCPFCGGKVSLSEVSFCWELMKFKCADCGTEFRMKDDIWNHRVYPPEVKHAVDRMKPKKVLDTRCEYDNRGEMFFIARCPSCGDDVFDDALFCECGQRLDWSEL